MKLLYSSAFWFSQGRHLEFNVSYRALRIFPLFQETASFPPAAFSLFPYPSFHLVSPILSPPRTPEVPVVVLFPNLQNPLKEMMKKKKDSECLIPVWTMQSTLITCESPNRRNIDCLQPQHCVRSQKLDRF